MNIQELVEAVADLRCRIHNTEPGFASMQDYIAVRDVPLKPLPYRPHPDEGLVPLPIDRKTALRHALWILAGAERCAKSGAEDEAKILLGMAMGILFVHRVRRIADPGDYESEQAESVLAAMLTNFKPPIFGSEVTEGASI
jgi:hypothetical protein